jgi:tetratricopeptide (TPR) repeat protein
MFERFTEKAIKVIMLAQEEARRLGHNFVGAEFIFLGLIGEATGIASKVLRQQGITLKNARIEVEKILGRGSVISPEMNPVDIPFTESAKLVLNSALSFADKLGSESIDTEHLLIGIFQQGESTGIILQNLQVNLKDLTVSLTQYFQQQPSNQLPQTVYVLLYNVGTDNEGIHTISVDDNHKILLFESQEDAATFAQQLGEQNFPVPSVEAMKAEEILLFCKNSGYDWEFIPKGTIRTPPAESAEIQGIYDDQTTTTANTPQDYFNFLMETLQKIHENLNPQVIYPFWAQNLDKLDDNLIQIFDSWAIYALSSVNSNQSHDIAVDIVNFSSLIQQFPLGNIAINKEIGITGCKIALNIFTFNVFPQQWINTQNNLANAYSNRIRGDIAENLEMAIACYLEVLKVCTFKKFPQQWAMTQNNLAFAYSDRIRGHKAENLEASISCYLEALKFYTFKAFPQEWAMTQNNLANAYRDRIRGDKAKNLEMAISCCQEALKVRTFETYPSKWANTQISLANAYSDRIRGEKAENLERAIAAYNEALKVYTFEAFPKDWANIQNNIALAYTKRIRGDKACNLERAIAYCQEALKVYTFDAFPQQWAMTQNNLAIAYSNRIRGEKAENIKQAVMCYQNALQGYETAGDFLNAAEMGLTLGKIKVDRGEWYQGLAYLEKSLKIYRQFDDLKSRADTIYQIAHTHHLIGNHEKASIYYRDALRFYEYLKHDRGVAFCQASLGRLMLQIGFVEKAEELLKKATFIFKELNNEQEIAKIAEVLNCLAKIKEKQAV